MEAEEQLVKETVKAFKAGLHGEEYENPFTEAEDAMKDENDHPANDAPHIGEDDARPS